jgi:CheY-like chemotaxis protein
VGGHEVASVGSGEECLAELVEHRPDVVVLDVMMPVMDGPMTLAAIRANPATADVPVVFLTASVLPPELAMLNTFDVAGVLRKPFDPMDLADSLGRLLQW